jgi:hypothetical protein
MPGRRNETLGGLGKCYRAVEDPLDRTPRCRRPTRGSCLFALLVLMLVGPKLLVLDGLNLLEVHLSGH